MYIWKDGKVVCKIDIEHDPIEEKYRTVKKEWYEYGNAYNQLRTYERGVYSGITDDFDFDDVDITDPDKVDEVDVYKAIQGSSPQRNRAKYGGTNWSRTQGRLFD